MKAVLSNLRKVRENSPLVHNITNFVVMNNTANALLALGASPIMSHAHKESEDMIGIVQTLVVNIGTMDEYWVESMLIAAKKAHEMKKPWVLDPVGAGATPFRNETLSRLLEFHPTVIRGNASEILAMAKENIESKGVDSTNTSQEALEAGKRLSVTTKAVVCISGKEDYIIDGDLVVEIANGDLLMAKVTGMGCTASALIGAFLGVEKDPFQATISAMAVMGVAGEIAAKESKGPGTLQLHFYDALYNLTESQLADSLKITIHEH
ncbi:hydroxyethylthiazole kinase [Lunatibacter salilacus]|uniref:hydroxyethylthiazole kinase n=1 Tax=Lunatibacter salilacus TaxID=2483804 RepID=UPI00131BEE1B|nr:hydroxyethylthiazole kinase [Lunatibacter salilacus]